ncbi:hypothetical protein L1049_001735 [Liquidambar formosana]|uniref:Uncharacterized protein n=1 Tax=Liquidambar formosana TaxID=63359 RepID=A0AAP0QXF0_LIQFO
MRRAVCRRQEQLDDDDDEDDSDRVVSADENVDVIVSMIYQIRPSEHRDRICGLFFSRNGLSDGLLHEWWLCPTWKKLFQMINDLPTVFEVVTGNIKQPKDQSATHNNSSKSKSSGKATNPYGMLGR